MKTLGIKSITTHRLTRYNAMAFETGQIALSFWAGRCLL